MAQLPESFNPATVEASTSYDPLPAGKYAAIIVDSDMKMTQSGSGQYLKLEFDIIDGPYKGRKLWSNLNLVNANDTAVQIARADLSAIAKAINVGEFGDSAMLHDKPLQITVKIKPASGQYEAGNEIKGYSALGATPTPAPAAVPPTAAGSNWLPS